MKKSAFTECLKAFAVGAVIGLFVMYLGKLDSVKTPIVFGIIAISIHARNNVYQKKNN